MNRRRVKKAIALDCSAVVLAVWGMMFATVNANLVWGGVFFAMAVLSWALAMKYYKKLEADKPPAE